MGYGDEIIGSGLARGAHARGKRIAFGDGRKIFWSHWAPTIYKNNPNVAPPGSEGAKDLEWISHYKGARKYNKLVNGRWVWNYDFRVVPGEFFFTPEEKQIAETFTPGFVVVEPNVPWQKKVWPNKDWGEKKYIELTSRLRLQGYHVVQFLHSNSVRKLDCDVTMTLQSLRDVAAIMSRAALYVGPEGGMHHAAAAVGTRAVVLFGGFIPPSVTGYDAHVNMTGNSKVACGNIEPCVHCRSAMESITVSDVENAALDQLTRGATSEVRDGSTAKFN